MKIHITLFQVVVLVIACISLFLPIEGVSELEWYGVKSVSILLILSVVYLLSRVVGKSRR